VACADVPRDAALIEVLLQTGLRIGEVAALHLADLTLPPRLTGAHTGAVRIRGNGRKERTVTLNSKALQALTAYLAVRPAVDTPAIFVSRFRRPLTVRAIRRVVKRHMAEAGIERASVHPLRHSFATHHVRQGTSLHVLQEALGHASLETTSIYVHLARGLMDEQLQAHAL
jgi:site-specific recombinase XerD